MLSYASGIDTLVRRRLLKYRDVKDEEDFDIPTAVVRMLKHNEVYQLPKRKDLDCPELFEVLEDWFEDLQNDVVSSDEHKLMRKKLIEHLCEDGIVDTTKYHLTANAKRDLLEEMKITPVEENLAIPLAPFFMAKGEMP